MQQVPIACYCASPALRCFIVLKTVANQVLLNGFSMFTGHGNH
jgi:hypothetical protein